MITDEQMQNLFFKDCPIRNILSRVGDKWSLLVLNALANSNEPMRFNKLQRELPDISQKMLTTTLRILEEDGFVIRTVYAEVPPRVEYCLTPQAVSFLEACRPMMQWAKDHMEAILTLRRKQSKK